MRFILDFGPKRNKVVSRRWSRPDLLNFSGAKGIRTPALTRQNAGLPACLLRLVPIQSRSLPAVLFSGLDGVKSVDPLPDQEHATCSLNRTATAQHSTPTPTPTRSDRGPGAFSDEANGTSLAGILDEVNSIVDN